MTKYVIYARYSSDLQSPDSIKDQERKCTEYAKREGWGREVRCYEDAAISGMGMDRHGLQQLMADAASPDRDFEILLVDDSSRLSRSLPDVLGLHRRLAHYGVRVIAVSQGIDTRREESEILFAVHGIADSLYVRELAKKTHRGLEGKFLKGLSAGGRCYGYDIVRTEGEGSHWVKNDIEAQVIHKIFEWSAAGYSLKRMAGMLNDRRTPPPQKREGRPHATWCPSAIREMLRRELYIGRKIWNKTKFVKSLEKNKRVARSRPEEEWVILEVPELRIISDDLWTRVQDRQKRLKEIYADCGRKPVNRGASSVYLLSGILRCGTCDARLIIVSGGKAGARYGCPQHWNRRACTNAITIRHGDIEKQLLRGLQSAVLSPEAVDYLVNKLASDQQRQNIVAKRSSRSEELRLEIARTADAIARVGHSEALLASLQAREAELREITGKADSTKDLKPEEIRDRVTSSLRDLPALLSKAPQLAKAKLNEHVDYIRLIPQPDGTYLAEGEWDLLGTRGPVMVAGAGFEPATFGL